MIVADQKLEDAIKVIRKYQRHVLLRTFDERGCLLPENLVFSDRLDTLIEFLKTRYEVEDRY